MYFRAFNFRTSQAVRKYFNNEIFAIYGNIINTVAIIIIILTILQICDHVTVTWPFAGGWDWEW